jgi:hypothetical protein
MVLQINEDDFNNSPSPEQFLQKLQELQSQLPAILADFTKYYVFFNKNPEYPEYEQFFQNIKSNLNNVNSKLFMLSNDVQSNTDKINEKLFALDFLIRTEKNKNRELKSKLGIVEHKNSAASELIYDYKEMYESGYLRNWALFLSIVVVGITISKTFKSI